VVVTVSRAENLANFLRRSEGASAGSGVSALSAPGRAAPGAGSSMAYRAAPAPTPAGSYAGDARLTPPARRPSIRSREGFGPGGGR